MRAIGERNPAEEILSIIKKDLGSRLEKFGVRISHRIFSEASVSAVVQFTWRNPASRRRERGVFEVLKPHIPEYFAEDMDYLQKLAGYFGDQHHTYGFPPHLIPDTFEKVRHEVNFRREQKNLLDATHLYKNVAGVKVPQVIWPLCSARISALSHEPGAKITSAVDKLPPERRSELRNNWWRRLLHIRCYHRRRTSSFTAPPTPATFSTIGEAGR